MDISSLLMTKCISSFNSIQSFWAPPTGKYPKQAVVWLIKWKQKHEWFNSKRENFVAQQIGYAESNTILEPGHVAAYVDSEPALVTILGIPVAAQKKIYDPEIYPFFFKGIYEECQTLMTMSSQEFLAVLESIPYPKDVSVTFLWNVARCGSTLLASMLNSINGWYTISEPADISHCFDLQEKYGKEFEIRMMNALLKLHIIQVTKTFPDCRMVVIKPRWTFFSATLDIKEIEGGPKYHHIFMYRDVFPCAQSNYKAFGDIFLNIKLNTLMADILSLRKLCKHMMGPLIPRAREISQILDQASDDDSRWLDHFESWQQLQNQPDYTAATYFLWDRQPLLQFFYRMLLKLDIPKGLFAVKYELLLKDPIPYCQRLVAKILSKDLIKDYVLADNEVEALTQVFHKDSQQNSCISRNEVKKNERNLSMEDKACLRIIARSLGQEAELEPGFILPNTLE